jgi:hypothetical protein
MIEAAWYAGLCPGVKDTRCISWAWGNCQYVMRNARLRVVRQTDGSYGSGR